MKKMISIIAVAALTFALTACGGSSQAATDTQAAENSTPVAVEEQKETVEAAEQTEAQPEAAQETAEKPANEAPAATDHSDVLVVYFSATGTTEGVAERIANVTGADVYEILAAEPYTEADLNYNDNSSRSTTEQNDKSVRPEIGSEDISLEGYTTIYLGFPIWWGEEPRILDTFVEKYNFDGITVIPFCTSGSSGIGRSGSNMEELAGNGTWLEGERFSGGVSEEELKSWIEGLQ